MFKELKAAWREVLKSQSSVVDRDSVCVMVPDHVFKSFEREFNLCFVEPEDKRNEGRVRCDLKNIAN
jgi:hypothetical protein